MDDTGTAVLAILVIGLGCLIGSLISGWLEVVTFREASPSEAHAPVSRSAAQAERPLSPLVFACPACHLIEGRAAHRCAAPGTAVLILEEDLILGSPSGLHHERVRGRLELQNLYRSAAPELNQDMGLVVFDTRQVGVRPWQ